MVKRGHILAALVLTTGCSAILGFNDGTLDETPAASCMVGVASGPGSCAPGSICVNNRCAVTCLRDATCPPEEACSGRTPNAPGPQDTAAGSAPPGSYCQPGPRGGAQCDATDMCQNGQRCVSGMCAAPSFCSDGGPQCPDGQQCVAGSCRTPPPSMGIVLASLGSTATEPSIVTLGTSMYFTYKESIYACDATSGCPSLQPSGALMGPSSPSAVVRFGSEIAWTQTATNSGTVFACNPADCVTKGTLSVDGGLGRAVGLASLEVKSRLVWLAQANADLQLFAWTQPDGFGQSEGASLIPNGTPFGVAVAAVDEGHIFAVVGGRLFGISGGKVSLVPGGGLDDTAIPAAITFAGGLVAWRVGQALHQCETQPSDTMPCKTPTLAVNGTAGTSITALTSPQANTGTPNRMILWAEFDSNSHTSQIKSCMLTAAVDMAMSCASPVVKGQFRFRVKAMYADTAKNQLYVVTRDDRPADGALVTGEIRMLAF